MTECFGSVGQSGCKWFGCACVVCMDISVKRYSSDIHLCMKTNEEGVCVECVYKRR